MKLECLPADVFQATIFFRLQTSGTIPILTLSQPYSFSGFFAVAYALHIGI